MAILPSLENLNHLQADMLNDALLVLLSPLIESLRNPRVAAVARNASDSLTRSESDETDLPQVLQINRNSVRSTALVFTRILKAQNPHVFNPTVIGCRHGMACTPSISPINILTI